MVSALEIGVADMHDPIPDDLITLTGAPQTGNYSSDNTTPWAFVRLKVHSAGQSVTMRLLPSRTV